MRCLYREQIYHCGNYTSVNLYPVFSEKAGTRRKKSKPTDEVQTRLNEHNAEQKLIRLLNANFTEQDIEIHLTYDDRVLPEDDERARRDVQNFLRCVKRRRSALGLPELKYISVTEGGDGKRYHHHVTMSGGIDRDTLEAMWGFGYANSRRLQFNANGVEGLARYLTKQFAEKKEGLAFRKRWNASKNLIHPEPEERDGRISAKKAKELATLESESFAVFERLYPGFICSDVRPFYNEVNGGYYLHIKLYREGSRFGNRKRRKEKERKYG